MRNIEKILLTLAASFLLALPLSASSHGNHSDTSIQDVQKQTKDLIQSFKSYTVDKKDEALKNAKSAMKKLDKNIDILEDKVDKKWDSMTHKARQEAREDLKELRKTRNELAQNYGNLEASSQSAWEKIKSGFTKAYEKLANSWEKAEQEFSSKE